jgi:HSP20 family protein
MSLVRRLSNELNWPTLFPDRSFFDLGDGWTEALSDLSIRVEEFEDGGELIVRAEIPGVDPEKDVEITKVNGSLRISVQRHKEEKQESRRRYRSEFHYGSFTRTIPLPAGTSEKDVKATYVDGILEVHVPLNSVEAKAERIPISRQ